MMLHPHLPKTQEPQPQSATLQDSHLTAPSINGTTTSVVVSRAQRTSARGGVGLGKVAAVDSYGGRHNPSANRTDESTSKSNATANNNSRNGSFQNNSYKSNSHLISPQRQAQQPSGTMRNSTPTTPTTIPNTKRPSLTTKSSTMSVTHKASNTTAAATTTTTSSSLPRRTVGGNGGGSSSTGSGFHPGPLHTGSTRSTSGRTPTMCTPILNTTTNSSNNGSTSTTTTNCATVRKCVNMCEAYGVVCPWAAVVAARTTKKTIQELFHHSKLFDPHNPPIFRPIRAQELRLGDKLGEGGFSIVSKCTLLSTRRRRSTTSTAPLSDCLTTTEGGGGGSGDNSTTCSNMEGSEEGVTTTPVDPSELVDEDDKTANNSDYYEMKQELAIKYLRRRAMLDYHHFKHGAADLAVEAYFLQTLSHPNIIQLHGIAAGSMEANILSRNCGVGGCFLVLDRLVETLEQRIEGWKKMAAAAAAHHGVGVVTTSSSSTTTTSRSNGGTIAAAAAAAASNTTTAVAATTKSTGTTVATTTTTTTGVTTKGTTTAVQSTTQKSPPGEAPPAAAAPATATRVTTPHRIGGSGTTISTAITPRQPQPQSYFSSWSRSLMAGMVRVASGSNAYPDTSVLNNMSRRRWSSNNGGNSGGMMSLGGGMNMGIMGANSASSAMAGLVVLATRGLGRKKNLRQLKRVQLLERLEIAHHVAQAMEYLHNLNVMFRDLKPSNIGFNAQGTLKLFDFGLAKEIKGPPGSYRLTGHTGSRRYMAPEVAKGSSDYDLSVDVYGFGIMLWELCCAQKPFYGYSSNKHTQLVVIGGERPKMEPSHTRYWPNELQTLMKNCWSAIPAQRPPFTQIVSMLQHIIDHEKAEMMEYIQQHQQQQPSSSSSLHGSAAGGTSSSDVDGDDNKSLASLSEDAVTSAKAAAAAAVTQAPTEVISAFANTPPSSSLGLAWDKAQSSNARLQSPLSQYRDEEFEQDNHDDDLSMIRPRRFNFLPNLSFFQRSRASSLSQTQPGRTRSLSCDRGRLIRSSSWRGWRRSRSKSSDSVRSPLQRQRRQSSAASASHGSSSSVASEFVPPALISGTSVIQVLTAVGATEKEPAPHSLRLSSSSRKDSTSANTSTTSNPNKNVTSLSASSSRLIIMSKDSEASVGREQEASATVTTASSSGEDLELSFHSAVAVFVDHEDPFKNRMQGQESPHHNASIMNTTEQNYSSFLVRAVIVPIFRSIKIISGRSQSDEASATTNNAVLAVQVSRMNQHFFGNANLMHFMLITLAVLQILLIFYQLGWMDPFVPTLIQSLPGGFLLVLSGI